jgi:aminoglycoside phosphotransferase family enzyme/predicted kinase
LSDPEEAEVAAWFAGRADRSFETACARIFLAGDTAFKVKRRVELGYLDYSTPDLRLWALERELAFNQAAASDIYRAVRRVTRAPAGGLELDGPGPVVEHVLEMRRFDEDAVLSAQPWALDGALAEALGRTVAQAHAAAPLRPLGGGGKALKYTIESNAHLIRELAPQLGHERVEALLAATDAEYVRREALLDARRDLGFARRCHADLHLGNILLEHGRPVLFDCIEFNDVLSEIDVYYDLAFLLMDLDFRRRRDGAVRVLSAYLDGAARAFPEGLWEGLAALPLMLSVRAGVRTHVCAHSGDLAGSAAYLDAALAHLSPAPPSLLAVGGRSGSGKSSFARLVAPGLGASPGAVILRSDEVRKRLAGAAADAGLPDAAYGPGTDGPVYDALFAEAGRALAAGCAVALDATFLHPDLRARAAAVARAAGVPFQGVWLEAPPQVLATRVAARRGDASDATLATLHSQLAADAGPLDWTVVDATGPVEDAAEAWTRAASNPPFVA